MNWKVLFASGQTLQLVTQDNPVMSSQELTTEILFTSVEKKPDALEVPQQKRTGQGTQDSLGCSFPAPVITSVSPLGSPTPKYILLLSP